jgi:hypothetical protein
VKVPGIPFDPGKHPQGPLAPTAIVLHRTYGAFGKDGYRSAYAIGKNGRGGTGIGFHFLIGKNAGQVVQFYDTAVEAAHAKGANSWSVGIEFDGVNEDVLTDWRRLCVSRTRSPRRSDLKKLGALYKALRARITGRELSQFSTMSSQESSTQI